jgi:EmrB/QacA subfamily drug resistance transporter
MTSAQEAGPAAVGLRSERGPVLAALMMSTALVALDSTIIATAVPSIVRQLGGFSQFPWLFSVYLLAQAVTVPLYGKFADLRGRRPVLLLGIGLFLVGSVACGFAWNMAALIVFRGLQGIGAGAVQPITMTVVGDLYTVAERARVQGYLASVWAVSSVLGPTLGGLFSQYLTWRWIFFVNLPVGALAAWMLLRHFHEQVTTRRHSIDVAGAALLTTGCSLVILGLLEGGVAWAWGSVTSVLVFVVGTALLVGFVAVERRASEPVLPLWVFRPRVLVGGNLAAAMVGALLIGLSSYVPTYVQTVLGTGALVAGFALAPLTVGWPLAASFAGRVYLRLGFRDTALIGGVVVVAGTVLVALLGAHTRVWQVGAACFVVGVGLGLANVPTVVAVQSVVGWEYRGMVTGSNMFSRSIGSAVGVALFGAVANSTLAGRLADHPASLAGHLPASVDAASSYVSTPAASSASGIAGQAAAFVRAGLYDAVHHVFLGLVLVGVALTVAVLVMPRRVSGLDPDAVPHGPAGG